MDMDEIVCTCLGTTNGMIKEAVENGARTVTEIQSATDAGTICGACLEDLEHLVEYFVSGQE